MKARHLAAFTVAAVFGLLCLAPIYNPPSGGVAVESDPVFVAAKDTDGTLAANSDAKIATQRATKTALDAKQTAAQVQALIDATGGKLLDTTGAPDNGLGVNGDYAFDDATKTIYGPKAAGVWPSGTELAGSAPDDTPYSNAWTDSLLAPTQGKLRDKIQDVIASIPTTVCIGAVHTADSFSHADLGGVITGVTFGSPNEYSVAMTDLGDTNYSVNIELGTPAVWTITSKFGTSFTISTFGLDGNPLSVDVITISVTKTPTMVAP